MNRNKTKAMAEGAVMIALATVLSILKLVEMPYGGSVTFASMLPLVVLSYRHGAKFGLGAALVFAIMQQLLGLKNLSYFTTPLSIIAIILLDYLLAFCLIGLSGVFRKVIANQAGAMVVGSAMACIIRYICHVISGATVWVGLSIPDSAALIYSLGYNATYMLPETVVLCAAAYYIGSVVDFTREIPSRMPARFADSKSAAAYAIGGVLILGALIADVAIVAPFVQDPEDGRFDLSYLAGANWTAVGIISGVALCAAAVITLLNRARVSRSN